MFKYPVRTAKRTQYLSIIRINWLTLFREIIAVYSENKSKSINTLFGQNAVIEP
jgi:hypothetical protein